MRRAAVACRGRFGTSIAAAIAAWFALTGAVVPVALAQKKPAANGKRTDERTGADSTDTKKTVPENADEIDLSVGETKTLSARNVKNFSEGVPGLVDIKLTSDNSAFVLHGRRAGSSALLLIYNDGTQRTVTINVWSRSPAVVEKEITQLLDGVAGIRIRRVAGGLVVDGQVSSESDVKRVQQVAALYSGQVRSLVTTEGGIATAPGDERAYLIRVDVYYVQFDKTGSYSLGLGWPGAYGATMNVNYNILAGAATTATANMTNFPLPRLDMAARHGWARILKQSSVVTNNGVEAKVASGGEQNYKVITNLTAGLVSVKYGADISVVPRFHPERNDIDIRVVADVSDLTSAEEADLPGRTTSKLATQVTLKLGQALVLSGIRNRNQIVEVADGIPFLSQIPIIGVLFGSYRNNNRESQGAIFVVPSVSATVPVGAADFVDGAMSAFRKYDGDLSDVNSIVPDGAAAARLEQKKSR